MKIETELNGNIVISPSGDEGDTLVYVRKGRVTQIAERDGKLRQEDKGRAVGFQIGEKFKFQEQRARRTE